jgi:hypothetical protein
MGRVGIDIGHIGESFSNFLVEALRLEFFHTFDEQLFDRVATLARRDKSLKLDDEPGVQGVGTFRGGSFVSYCHVVSIYRTYGASVKI